MLNKKVLALLLTTSTFNAVAAEYYLMVPIPGRQSVPITITLAPNNLPDGEVNKLYTGFDFQLATQVSGGSDFVLDSNSLKFTAANLPPGMVLGPNGFLSGTPTTKNTIGTTFTVIATYNENTGQQNYVLKVGAARLNVKQIALGFGHTCVLTTSGGVKCWGNNAYGQLGDGTTTTAATAVDVQGLTSGVVHISSGNYSSCAVLATGTVKCWGQGTAGNLGQGSKTNSSVPVTVVGISNAAKVSADIDSTCVVTTSGGVKCWGSNTYGQLGDGSTTESLIPVTVTNLGSGVADIKKNTYASCALMVGGGLKCWGNNGSGQLGNGVYGGTSTVPVDVSGLTSNVVSFSVGALSACAVTSAGAVKCWGYNSYGQVGDGSTTVRTTPVTVSGLTSGATSVSAGLYHACARMTAGNVRCWGWNFKKQLGNGTTTNSSVPVDVPSVSGILSLEAGSHQTCIIENTQNSPQCWGGPGATPVDVGI